MTFYTHFARPLLFRIDPESTHGLAMMACRFGAVVPGIRRIAKRCYDLRDERLATEVAGLQFPLPIGLAAGWDKSGQAIGMLDSIGFGFAEIGSVSAKPSPGNARPRLFRVPDEEAIVVNYGLPNDGAVSVSNRLAQSNLSIPIGVNVVKTNDGRVPTNDQDILDDYVDAVTPFRELADYLTFNLSCPNAAGCKDFFTIPGNIARLLDALDSLDLTCPIFLKVPPSDAPSDHERWIAEVDQFPFVTGFMFNLAPDKPAWLHWEKMPPAISRMPGAVAGPPVAKRMLSCITALSRRLDRSRHVVIGGGGIRTAEDAWNQIVHGASLVQIYSALIYQGPSVARNLHLGILDRLDRSRFSCLADAVGSEL